MRVYVVYTLVDDEIESILAVFSKEDEAVQYLDSVQEARGSWREAAMSEFELDAVQ